MQSTYSDYLWLAMLREACVGAVACSVVNLVGLLEASARVLGVSAAH